LNEIHNTPDDLRLKGRWVHGIRLLFIVVFMVTVTISSWDKTSSEPELYTEYNFFYYLCAVYSVFTILVLMLHDRVKQVRRFILFQTSIDSCFLLVMVYLTGGHQSLAIPMLDMHIVFVVYLLGRSLGRGMILFISAGVCLIVSVYLGHSGSGLPLNGVLPEWSTVAFLQPLPTIGNLLINCSSFIVLGELSGQLHESLNRARVVTTDVLDPLLQGVIVTDTEGRVLQINPAAIRLTGSRLDLVNKSLVSKDLQDEVLDLIFAGQEDYAEFDLEVDGVMKPVECHAMPMVGAQKNLLGMVITLTDTSDRQEIEKMKGDQQRSETIATLASGIAHEVRNPLAAMRSALQILQENFEQPNQEQQRMMELVTREGDRLDNIVGSFLDFSKLRPRVLAHTSLTDLIDETARLLEIDPSRQDCRIVNEVSENIFAKVDPEQIKQVILNLGLNAFQAMNSIGHQEGTLTFRNRQRPGWTIIEVSDQGPGILPEAKGKLFDPFFTTKHEGTGMGLAVVDRIVRAHGGKVTVTNLSDGGCRFDIEFRAIPT
jgi:PAS domain S-box-containing protein